MTTVAVLTTISLLVNIAVLVPVVIAIITDAAWTGRYFGSRTPGRDILLSLYVAILGASIVLLVLPVTSAVVTLLVVQIAYKIMTAVTVRQALRNPVVISNLGIACLHGITVAAIATR